MVFDPTVSLRGPAYDVTSGSNIDMKNPNEEADDHTNPVAHSAEALAQADDLALEAAE